MAQDSTHELYEDNIDTWTMCRDCFDGEKAVKDAGERYLPRMGGMDSDDYNAYKMRAMFYNATARSVDGLSGAMFRKQPIETIPKSLVEYLKNVGADDESHIAVVTEAAVEVLTVGRFGMYVDADSTGQYPFIATYYAENIINWEFMRIAGAKVPVMIMLKETKEVDGEDPYDKECEPRWRELYLDFETQPPTFRVRVWKKVVEQDENQQQFEKFVVEESYTPAILGGQTLDFIPFRIVNADGTIDKVCKPPVQDLVAVNLSHYRTSADLEHGRHFTSLPTPYVTGVEEKTGKVYKIGSGTAWTFTNPNAKAGYLEFTGAGLGSLENALEEKETKMAVLGARLLEEQKRMSEAADTVRLRQAGEGSLLVKIAGAISDGFTQVLKWVALWKRVDEAEIEKLRFSLSKDFIGTVADPALVAQWNLSVLQGTMSWDTFFWNLKRAEMVPEDRTPEAEKQLIQDSISMTQPGTPDTATQDNPSPRVDPMQQS